LKKKQSQAAWSGFVGRIVSETKPNRSRTPRPKQFRPTVQFGLFSQTSCLPVSLSRLSGAPSPNSNRRIKNLSQYASPGGELRDSAHDQDRARVGGDNDSTRPRNVFSAGPRKRRY